MDVDEQITDDVDLANAVNLSESEDEVEEEQIAGDFFTTRDPSAVRVCPLPSGHPLSSGPLGIRHTRGQSLLPPIPIELPYIYLAVIYGC